MKWMKARSEKICSACDGEIAEGEMYFGGSYQTFCKTCAKDYKSGKIRYSVKEKTYIDITKKKTCDFCEESSVGVIHGKSVCSDHIGNVIDDQI
jgi:hypothetical protein